MKPLVLSFNGFGVVVWREGQKVLFANPGALHASCGIKAGSVPEARSVIRALSDLALKATQFGHEQVTLDYVRERVIEMVEGARWFATRKRRMRQ